MVPNFLLPRFFPQDSIKLGRFLTDVENPHYNYHDPVWSAPITAVTSPVGSYIDVRKASASSGLRSSLTSLLSAGFSKQSKTEMVIATDSASTLSLDNAQDWFKEAMKLKATQTWIEEQVDQGDKIYMIVGFASLNNTRVSFESLRETTTEGQAQLPVTSALAAAGAVVPLVGDLLDPAIGGNLQALDGVQSKFLVPGDQICALQLCKVNHAWFSAKRLDTSRLSKPWWFSDESWRGGDDDDQDDIIEVELTQLEDPDEEWAKVVSGGETFYSRFSEKTHKAED